MPTLHFGDDAMKLTSLAVAVSALSLLSATPAPADFVNRALVYLGPELPNYLTAPGPARCSWADLCWYRIARGPDIVVAPIPVVVPRVKAKR